MRKAILRILSFINAIFALALICAYVSVYIPPDVFWTPSLFGLAYPFLLIINVLFIVFWLLFKPRNVILSVLVIAIGWGYLSRYVQLKGNTTDEEGIRVLSYNVQHFKGNGQGKQKENAEKIISFIDSVQPDIICLQESRLRKNNIFNLAQTVKKLKTIKHYQFASSSTSYGSVTMTRYPIVNMGEIRFENSRNISIYTDVLIDFDTVRIFNIHLQSYQIDPNKYTILESPTLGEEENMKEVQEIGVKFKEAFQLRAEQVREIRKYINESPYNVIVCGDFNDTPISFSYKMLSDDLIDAFVNSGKGIGRTYIGKLPSFRIDYILHGEGFESYNFKTHDFELSDHLPISGTLLKKNN